MLVLNSDAISKLLGNCCSQELLSLWMHAMMQYTQVNDKIVLNNLLQHVYDDLIPQIAGALKPPLSTGSDIPSVDQLTSDEKAVLHYAIGYTARKLTKKISAHERK